MVGLMSDVCVKGRLPRIVTTNRGHQSLSAQIRIPLWGKTPVPQERVAPSKKKNTHQTLEKHGQDSEKSIVTVFTG